MEEEQELFQLVVIKEGTESDCFATQVVHQIWQDSALTATQSAHQVGQTKGYSVDFQNTAEELATLGNSVIHLMILECSEDVSETTERDNVSQMALQSIQNANPAIQILDVASVGLMFPFAPISI